MSAYDFERLCVPHRADLIAFARSLVRDRDAAQDLVQDAYVRALMVWDAWRPTDPTNAGRYARAWMFKILTTTFLDSWRRGRHRSRRVERGRAVDTYETVDHDVIARGVIDELYDGRDYQDPRELLEADDVSDVTVDALLELRPDQREVLVRRYLRGETDDEIAPTMPRKTAERQVELVRKRAHQAYRAIAPKLADYARREYGMRAELPEHDVALVG